MLVVMLVAWLVVIPATVVSIGALLSRVRARRRLVVRVRLDPSVKTTSD